MVFGPEDSPALRWSHGVGGGRERVEYWCGACGLQWYGYTGEVSVDHDPEPFGRYVYPGGRTEVIRPEVVYSVEEASRLFQEHAHSEEHARKDAEWAASLPPGTMFA